MSDGNRLLTHIYTQTVMKHEFSGTPEAISLNVGQNVKTELMTFCIIVTS